MQLLLSSPVRPSTKSDSFAWTVGLSKSAKMAKALDRAMQVLLTNGGQDRCRSCRDITLRARLCDYRVYPSFEQNAQPSTYIRASKCRVLFALGSYGYGYGYGYWPSACIFFLGK